MPSLLSIFPMKFIWNTKVWLRWVHLFQDVYFGIQPKGPVNFQCQNFIYFTQSMCHMMPNPEGYQITLDSALFSLSLLPSMSHQQGHSNKEQFTVVVKSFVRQSTPTSSVYLALSSLINSAWGKHLQALVCCINLIHGHQPSNGPFSETSSAGSGSCSRSKLSEYESDWPPLTVGSSSPTGGVAAHSCPAAEAGMGSPLLKLLDSSVLCPIRSACCCCFCKAAWNQKKHTRRVK